MQGAESPTRFGKAVRHWSLAGLVTIIAAAAAWQIRNVTGVNLAYASAFVVVGILLNESLVRGLASFVFLGLLGLAFMHSNAEVFALFVIGISTTIAQVLMTARSGERLTRLRDHLSRVERLLQRSRRSLNQAGVLVIMLDEDGTWVAANPVALEAFGIHTDSVDFTGPTIRINAEAVLTLMSPGSQESWLHMVRTSLTGWGEEGQRWAKLALTSAAGVTHVYDMHLDRTLDGSIMMIGQKSLPD